ncbi:MAG: tetratricopeptide TPR_4 [uncultured bacterium]|nr:MAG: tetratricopeptide TPR_4 [uncultured bacterium]
MLRKINRQFSIIWLLVIGLLVYSRFVNLGWGLPYPMHPDERNMATAIQQLNCIFSITNFQNCFNPHFFAYGQFPLYLGYLIVYILKFFDGDLGTPIGFQEATISLRIISAVASIISVILLIKIILLISNIKNQISKIHIKYQKLLIAIALIFLPYAIQFAHFGTTESLLMLLYLAIIYFSLLFIDKKINTLSFVINSSLLIGMSLSTKVSSLIFLTIPLLVLLFNQEIIKFKTSTLAAKNSLFFFGYRLMSKIIDLSIFIFLSLVVFFIFSPHNFINFRDFVSSMNYESDVALGRSLVFYTRQFVDTSPLIFQLINVFPYALGWPTFILGSLGFVGLSWKDKKINLLRFSFLIYFIPSAMIYAKWSRFMTPIFPLILIFAILFILRIKVINVIKIIIIIIAILPGIAYLSVYQNPDVRFQASEWIYKNIPNNSYILFETANVVDIPIPNPKFQIPNLNYQTVSFNFYDLDQSPELQMELVNYIGKADYIFVPSRRIFANHTCYKNDKLQITNNKCQILKQEYPILNKYYEDLFSGKLGFEKVAEFESFPKICWPPNNNCLVFEDEQSEETWTVFDHPVIRIYKKVKSS